MPVEPVPTAAQPWIGPDGQVMRRLELHLTYSCPERCVFCSEDDRMRAYKKFPVTFARVATVLRHHAAHGVRAVHFTGGEPTIHPRFIDVLRLAKKLGMRTSVGTIGTMLARPGFAEQAVPFLDEALFSIHGPSAEVHDRVAGREGSFERVTTAFSRCRELNPDFSAFANTVLCSHNIEALPDTVRFLDQLGAVLVVVSNTTPEGAAYHAYEELAVRLEDLARVLRNVKAERAVVRFFGVPMCLLGPQWTHSNDLHWDPRVTVEWGRQPGKVVFTSLYNWTPDRKRVHAPECEGCARRDVCMGVYDRYAELWPTDQLTPMS
jgi:MoaA/NifB/PqqE/SkfB family radical SAM enzyme